VLQFCNWKNGDGDVQNINTDSGPSRNVHFIFFSPPKELNENLDSGEARVS
jgi:hypothetical protein